MTRRRLLRAREFAIQCGLRDRKGRVQLAWVRSFLNLQETYAENRCVTARKRGSSISCSPLSKQKLP